MKLPSAILASPEINCIFIGDFGLILSGYVFWTYYSLARVAVHDIRLTSSVHLHKNNLADEVRAVGLSPFKFRYISSGSPEVLWSDDPQEWRVLFLRAAVVLSSAGAPVCFYSNHRYRRTRTRSELPPPAEDFRSCVRFSQQRGRKLVPCPGLRLRNVHVYMRNFGQHLPFNEIFLAAIAAKRVEAGFPPRGSAQGATRLV